jgi:hypothetical protein
MSEEPKFKQFDIVNVTSILSGQEPLMVLTVHEKDSGVHRYDLQTQEGDEYSNIGEYEMSLAPSPQAGGN